MKVGDTVVLKGGSHVRYDDEGSIERRFSAGDEIEIESEAELAALQNKVAVPAGGGPARTIEVSADYSYRGLPMASEDALLAAVEGDLDPEALEGVELSGQTGYGAAQVREAVEGGGEE